MFFDIIVKLDSLKAVWFIFFGRKIVAETNILIVDLCEDIKQYSDTLENSSIVKKYPEILLAAIIDDSELPV